uniref:Heme attachment to plastid cytochrome c n=1 Tax=Najas flexilis TaxID=29650 RepID=S4TBB7_9LILI|nr:heme attachment to plastid cytochrome c [Najas flexilis]AFY64139.1 heme attachment to plastid cytochrome c [Najas flexilis]
MIFVTLEHIFTHISFSIVSVVIMIHFLNLLVQEIIELWDSSEKGMTVTLLFITGLLVIRWYFILGTFSLKQFIRIINLPFVEFPRYSYDSVFLTNRKTKKYLRAIMAPSAILTQAFAISGLSTGIRHSPILVPALQSQWLMMHVSMMLLSYAALLFGSLFSIALLVITFRKNINILCKTNNLPIDLYLYDTRNILQSSAFLSLKNYYKYQLIQKLDYWSYRVISLGFIFLTIGILSGAVWANEAWGSYWNWDPKETWAFITWTIYAIYLHTRTNQRFQGINSAIVACIGFFIIWICYFGVNLLGIGLS